MPTTYNGIGTHYYGKSNLITRQGVCPHCHRTVNLASYDTRLWFVVVFIPVIPLGSKRIIDQCPSCRRHYVVEKQKWETAKQLEISGAEEAYRKNPTPEGAVAVHQQLLKFHQADRAAEFQKILAETYADHAKVQAYLAAALHHLGQYNQAASFYERALALRPDLPEARIGVAEARLRTGQLDGARKLLDFLEKPGAGQLYSLRPLEILAIAYQKANHHKDALELFGRLLAELPNIAEVPGFRKMVAKSEKALAQTTSIIPKKPFSWRRLFSIEPWKRAFGTATPSNKRALTTFGVLLALVALGFVVSNEYIRRHRTVYLVNALSKPATVRISGVAPLRPFRGLQQVELAEGTHNVNISGPVQQHLDLQVSSSYFGRWFNKPVWVVNVGAGGILMLEHVTYGSQARPATFSFHFGRQAEFFPDVDYAFSELPESLQMHANETRVLSHLQIFRGGAGPVYEQLRRAGRVSEALDFAEKYLSVQYGDDALVVRYGEECTRLRQTERLERFLNSGLTNRPVAVEWHRLYQTMHQTTAEQPQLIARYDEFLVAEPENSALLYLRGRIEPDRAAATAWFEHSARNDTNNAFSFYALGYDQMAGGNWVQARTYLENAVRAAPADFRFGHALFVTRLALGEAPTLEKEQRRLLSQKPFEVPHEIHLVHALAAQGRNQEAMLESSRFGRQILQQYGATSRPTTALIERDALYAVGDFADLEKICDRDSTPGGRQAMFEALIEEGRIQDAKRLFPEASEDQPFLLLALSVAAFHQRDTNFAAELRSKAEATMCKSRPEIARLAPLLSRGAPITEAEARSIVSSPDAKALLLAALFQLHPEAPHLGIAARRFNIDRIFPYHLVQRVTAAADGGIQIQ